MTSLPNSLAHLGRLVETHASWVFLGKEFVFKFKKPVDFGFLDFTTLDKRKAACEAELRLNARLSPDVYLGLIEVRSSRDGVDIRDHESDAPPKGGSDDELIDYGIRMRRLDDAIRGDMLLDRGALDISHIDELCHVLADFHARCATSEEISAFGTVSAISENVEENFRQTRSFILDFVPRTTASEIETAQRQFLERGSSIFAERERGGFIRDGHGDLRLDHLYFEDRGVRIIDCIEFNERFRYGDTCADLAFLVMDLGHRGRPDLAEYLLAEYARLTRDYQLYSVVDFYESYRATVRAKVTAFRMQQESDPEQRHSLSRAATEYFEHAAQALRPASRRPRLICIGGKISSGKSTVAARVRRSACPALVDSDRTRKHLAGLAPREAVHEQPFAGLYSPEFSKRVYDRLAEIARTVLASGRSTIVEATFSKRAERRRFAELADTMGVEMTFVECRVSDAVARERLLERSRKESVSDGRLEIYDDFVKGYEPVEPDEFERLLTLDTERSEEEQRVSLERVGLG